MKRIALKFYGKQHDFVTAKEMHTAFIAGIGAGKTYAGAVRAIMEAKRGTVGLVVSPTFGMLRDSTYRTFKDLSGPLILKENRGEFNVRLINGAEIMFRSADNPERLRGPNVHWAWIDEGSLCRRGTWEIVIGRLRADGLAGRSWTTTTPKGKNNWVYEATKTMHVITATTFDNPYVSDVWKNTLASTYTGNFLQQELYAEFVSHEGLVYPQFQPHHIQRLDVLNWSFGLGVDDGYSNPAVILKVYQRPDGGYHIGEEYYERGKLQSEVVNNVIRMAGGMNPDVNVDSSATALIAELKNRGLRARGTTHIVLNGIKYIQELLAANLLTVDPSCVNTISEFESYQWKPGTEQVVKENDHAMDALRYFLNKQRTPKKATQRSYY